MNEPDKSTALKRSPKREAILEAARALFSEGGLEGASLRAIAGRAGYTPAALYFHFASKEVIYAELLRDSLRRLQAAVTAGAAEGGFRGAALALFDFYAVHPEELELSLHLYGGGLAPRGLGKGLDPQLNAELVEALAPLHVLGGAEAAAQAFAHAIGLLVLAQTRRIRLFGLEARRLMEQHLGRKDPP